MEPSRSRRPLSAVWQSCRNVLSGLVHPSSQETPGLRPFDMFNGRRRRALLPLPVQQDRRRSRADG